MDTKVKYDRLQNIMHDYADWVRSSARHVLKFVDLAGRSVVDFGCGRGDWLTIAQQLGADPVLGLDTYAIDGADLPIPTLRVDLTQPVVLETTYDVALCLEVGEHLDGKYARVLVQSLVRSAPLVLFSAAVPGQGGIHHVNEQPPAYWHDIFAHHGYRCFDFRHKIWNDKEIEPWYRMGVLLYAAPDANVGALGGYFVESPLHLIHPDIFEAYAQIGKDIVLHYDKRRQKWYSEALEP